MLNRNNTYFENLKRIGHEYEAARAERQARKQPIIDTYGWDSEELKAWYAEEEAAKFPFAAGTTKAYRAWAQSLRRQEDEVELDDFLWASEVTDFVEALREAGIATFCLHQPEHSGDGEPSRSCQGRLHDAGPLHHHPEGKPLGRRGALRGHGGSLQPELKTS